MNRKVLKGKNKNKTENKLYYANLKAFLLHRKYEFKYFCTFTFGNVRLNQAEKINYFKKFMNNLCGIDKEIAYFWVMEIGRQNPAKNTIHFHMICHWGFDSVDIEQWWNKHIHEESNVPNCRIRLLDESKTSYANRINYMFKDDIKLCSMSYQVFFEFDLKK